MFGYVNTNRRLESILRALARLKGELEFRFDVFGTLWDRGLIDRLIAECGLTDRVSIHGFVSEDDLDAAIGQAHLAFNLRHPTMGEASGGILRSWTLGTPALVTDAGWYATLPQEIAPRVSADDEVQGLVDMLRTLVSDPDRLRRIGEAARAHVLARHAPETYARQLENVLSGFPKAMTRLAARQMLERAALRAQSKPDRAIMLERAAQLVPALLAGAAAGQDD
jgi:glycosyltransferase involved in cell wall biosynthesis